MKGISSFPLWEYNRFTVRMELRTVEYVIVNCDFVVVVVAVAGWLAGLALTNVLTRGPCMARHLSPASRWMVVFNQIIAEQKRNQSSAWPAYLFLWMRSLTAATWVPRQKRMGTTRLCGGPISPRVDGWAKARALEKREKPRTGEGDSCTHRMKAYVARLSLIYLSRMC